MYKSYMHHIVEVVENGYDHDCYLGISVIYDDGLVYKYYPIDGGLKAANMPRYPDHKILNMNVLIEWEFEKRMHMRRAEVAVDKI